MKKIQIPSMRNVCEDNFLRRVKSGQIRELGMQTGYTPTGAGLPGTGCADTAGTATPLPRRFSQTSTYIHRCQVLDFNTPRLSSLGENRVAGLAEHGSVQSVQNSTHLLPKAAKSRMRRKRDIFSQKTYLLGSYDVFRCVCVV